MISRLTGVLAEKAPPHVLVDVQGVGYEVQVPMSTFYNLPELGAKVTLLTQFIVRVNDLGNRISNDFLVPMSSS